MWMSQRIPRETQDRILRELGPGERVQWADTPIPHFFSATGLGMFLFGIPWTAFAIFWVAAAASGIRGSDAPGVMLLFPLFGVPFVLVGFGMLSAPLRNYRRMARTVYVITNRRVIFIELRKTIKMHSFHPGERHDVLRKEKRDGSGDLVVLAHGRDQGESSANLELSGVRDVRMMESFLQLLLK